MRLANKALYLPIAVKLVVDIAADVYNSCLSHVWQRLTFSAIREDIPVSQAQKG